MNKTIKNLSVFSLAAIVGLTSFASFDAVKAAENTCQNEVDGYHFCVSHTVDKATAHRGDVLNYTAIITNDGENTLNTVFASLHLSPYVTYVPGSGEKLFSYSDQVVPIVDNWLNTGDNSGNLEKGEWVKIMYQATVKDDAPNDAFAETTIQVKTNSTGTYEDPNWFQCATHTIVKVPTPTPTPTPTPSPTPTPTPEPTPTPTPKGEVKGATPTPTPAPVTELPATGPGAALVASLGGIVSALMGRKYFISR